MQDLVAKRMKFPKTFSEGRIQSSGKSLREYLDLNLKIPELGSIPSLKSIENSRKKIDDSQANKSMFENILRRLEPENVNPNLQKAQITNPNKPKPIKNLGVEKSTSCELCVAKSIEI